MQPRILTFTSLFPNSEQPMHGLFVRERIRALSKVCRLEVVAPVPWVPAAPGLGNRYRAYRNVASAERDTDGILVHHPRFFVLPKVLKVTDGLFMGLSCLPLVTRIRRSFRFDLVDAHWAYPDGAAAAVVAARLGVPFTVTVRGDDINVFGNERGRGAIIRRVLSRAALVIALSEDLKAHVLRMTGDRANVAVVPNGVNGEQFHPTDRDAARRRLGLGSDLRICVSVGRLHASKGIPILVDALARLPSGAQDVHLFIIGAPDPEADASRAIAARVSRHELQHRVHLVGSQTPAQLVDWYNAADLYCSATSREGSPNVLLEAMACGLPCVTTPVGGNREAVSTSEVGLLTPAEPASLAETMTTALTRSWNRSLIAERARGRTWAAVAEECRRQLLQLLPQTS